MKESSRWSFGWPCKIRWRVLASRAVQCLMWIFKRFRVQVLISFRRWNRQRRGWRLSTVTWLRYKPRSSLQDNPNLISYTEDTKRPTKSSNQWPNSTTTLYTERPPKRTSSTEFQKAKDNQVLITLSWHSRIKNKPAWCSDRRNCGSTRRSSAFMKLWNQNRCLCH